MQFHQGILSSRVRIVFEVPVMVHSCNPSIEEVEIEG